MTGAAAVRVATDPHVGVHILSLSLMENVFFSVLRSVAPAFFDPIGDPLWIFSSVSFACFLLSLCYCLHCIPGFYGSPRDKRKLITVTTMAAMSGTYNPGSV